MFYFLNVRHTDCLSLTYATSKTFEICIGVTGVLIIRSSLKTSNSNKERVQSVFLHFCPGLPVSLTPCPIRQCGTLFQMVSLQKYNNNNNNQIHLTASGLSPDGSGYYDIYKCEIRIWVIYVRGGGLQEKHAVTIWNLENHLSIRFYKQETKKNLCRGGRSQDLTDTDF
jgi:hypothetical protein